MCGKLREPELMPKPACDTPEKPIDFFEYADDMTIHYLYSEGEVSYFFKELKDHAKLYASKCPKCGFVYFPPRGHCYKCYCNTGWVPLTGKGTIETATVSHFGRSQFTDKMPIVIAFIKLVGSDMIFRHSIVMEDATLEKVKHGTPVKVVFNEKREGRVTDFYFVPDTDEQPAAKAPPAAIKTAEAKPAVKNAAKPKPKKK